MHRTKTVFAKMLLFCVLVFAVACKQENLDSIVTDEAVVETPSFKLNKTPIETLIANPDDPEDEYIKREEVKLAKILCKVVTDPKIKVFMVETGKANKGIITYETLFAKFPHLKPLFAETAIAKRLKLGENAPENSTQYDFTHGDYGYTSVINLPNYGPSSTSTNPVVAAELEIEDDIENGNHDIIHAWQIMSNGTAVEVNVGEKDAMQATNPIFVSGLNTVVQFSDFNIELAKLRKKDEDKLKGVDYLRNVLQTRGNSAQSHRYRINRHYDRSKSNEVYAAGSGMNDLNEIGVSNNEPRGIGTNPGGWYNSSFQDNNWHLVYIHRNYTGDPRFGGVATDITYAKHFFTMNSSACNSCPAPFQRQLVFYNIYERDWYAPAKALGTVKFFKNGSGSESVLVKFSGARVYHEEWFTFNPGSQLGENPIGTLSHERNTLFPFDRLKFGPSEFLETFDEDKGDLLFKRL